MIGDPSLIDWGTAASLVGYNERWRTYRRLMNTWLHKKAAEGFRESQTSEAQRLLQRLLEKYERLDTSQDLEVELYWTVASTVLRSVYGYQIKNLDDPFVVQARNITEVLTKAFFPTINALPALMYVPEWFPGAEWKRKARAWRKEKEEIIEGSYRWTKQLIAEGAGDQTIIAAMINQALKLGLQEETTEDYVQQIAFTLWAGGTDTTISTMMGFFVAMLLYPDVKIKAQKEIDEVVGQGRLPTLEDQLELPYMNRVVQETLRWFPATPLAVPHVCFEDDTYKGYNIPKGTILFGNVWAMTRDKAVYKNPEIFDPDRFLDPSVPFSPVFGWGRRRCPGIHFAETSLFITFASLLATFDISLAQDDSGNNIMPSRNVINGVVA
ncbi:cytochrome P450 [Ceratobasidium sp. AG-I]|nr:cytochrome P450 [Ceratobasidium sp. AG-I]